MSCDMIRPITGLCTMPWPEKPEQWNSPSRSGILPQNGRASGVNVMMPVVIVIGVRSSIHGNRALAASMQPGDLNRIAGRLHPRHVEVDRQLAHVVQVGLGVVDADDQPAAFGPRVDAGSARSRIAGLSRSTGWSGSGRVVR